MKGIDYEAGNEDKHTLEDQITSIDSQLETLRRDLIQIAIKGDVSRDRKIRMMNMIKWVHNKVSEMGVKE